MKILVVEVVQYGDYFESRYQRIRELGYDVRVLYGIGELDGRDQKLYRVAGSKHIDDIVEAARQWHGKEHFDGVTSLAETSIVATAHVGAALNLGYPSVEAARASRNKYVMRQAHRAGAVPHPRFLLVQTIPDIDRWSGGFPAIVKPTLGSASAMVFKVDCADELRERVSLVLDQVEDLAIFQLEADGIDLGPNAVLVEQFLTGHEHLIEGYVEEGEAHCGSLVDRITLEGDTFDDDVHHGPSTLDPEAFEDAVLVANAAVRAQGLDRCVTHVEVRFHNGHAFVVEAAARPGGGGLDLMARNSYGYDPLAATAELAVAGHTRQARHNTGVHTVAACLISEPGTIVGIEGDQTLAQHSDVFFFKLTAAIGSVVKRPPEGNDIAGFLGVSGHDFAETKRLLHELEQQLHITVERNER